MRHFLWQIQGKIKFHADGELPVRGEVNPASGDIARPRVEKFGLAGRGHQLNNYAQGQPVSVGAATFLHPGSPDLAMKMDPVAVILLCGPRVQPYRESRRVLAGRFPRGRRLLFRIFADRFRLLSA